MKSCLNHTCLNQKNYWIETILFAGEQHGIHCGCPAKTALVKTGQVSTLKRQLSVPRKSYIENFRKATSIANLFTREKASKLLVAMNVDINSKNIATLEKYTIEDILLVAGLIQAKKYDDLSEEYENILKCVNRSSNDPTLNIRKFFVNWFG